MEAISDTLFINQVNPSIAGDYQIQSTSEVEDSITHTTLDFIPFEVVLTNLQIHSDETLDLLGFLNRVEGYKETYDRSKKIALIQQSYQWKRIKGTNKAVNEILSQNFAYAECQSWYEYGGTAHHFRVFTTDPLIDVPSVEAATRLILDAKMASAWFEGFVRTSDGSTALYVGAAIASYNHNIMRVTR
jgi:P2-related tail formation protein